jgi:hypothetical protein
MLIDHKAQTGNRPTGDAELGGMNTNGCVLAAHFFTGAATALGAGVSMAFSEGLSDTGDLMSAALGVAAGG